MLRNFTVTLQRLKAALTNHGTGTQDGAGGVAGSSVPVVPQRQEQSQQPSQNSDAPSPVQPQVGTEYTLAVVFVWVHIWHYLLTLNIFGKPSSGVPSSAHRRPPPSRCRNGSR